jgi:hypothetical protein
MSEPRVFKKGEILFKEGDKATSLFIIQGGSVSVYLQRQKQKIELYTVGNFQILGEQILSGVPTHPATAVATTETKVIEMKVDVLKGQLDGQSQLMKLFIKSLGDKLKTLTNEVKSVKLEKDNSPCPQDLVAKCFASIYHTALHKGEKNGEVIKVNWPNMKAYAQKVFLESPKRLENALNIFVKLGMANWEMVKSPDDPKVEELGFIHLNDMVSVEQFFEFYQYYFFKAGKGDFLKVDDNCAFTTAMMLECAKTVEMDRRGAVQFEFGQLKEKFKTDFGVNLTNDSFSVLEGKGLFVKRSSTDKGVFISFDLKEWQRTMINWKILREIEKWNEKGFVDLKEPTETFIKKAKPSTGLNCPDCQAEYQENQKFCGECGCKLPAATAA